jgi:hypothetical protein
MVSIARANISALLHSYATTYHDINFASSSPAITFLQLKNLDGGGMNNSVPKGTLTIINYISLNAGDENSYSLEILFFRRPAYLRKDCFRI